ncbi:hypothetical protein ACRAWC_09305 [Leifsonia sp. L25]|uniref:hypothetical protein n=1 Tax=Actinomycetes TaxID=1760 RepID=UPI003D68BCDF
MIDRAEEDFPEDLLQSWKTSHLEKIEAALGVNSFPSREAARAAIEPMLIQNWKIFETRGPHNDYQFDPESEQARMWQRDMTETVIPNLRAVLRVLDANRDFLTLDEKQTLEEFRLHVRDMEGRHVKHEPGLVTQRYPSGMEDILAS